MRATPRTCITHLGTSHNPRVVIVDDGKGLMPGNAGMGTALLDQACPGHWTLTQNAEGGCTFSATIQRVATGMP